MSLITALILLAVGSAGFVLMRRQVSHRALHALIALGAGVMISVSLLHILPEASELDERAFLLFGLGFTLMYLLENVVVVHTCIEVDAHCHYHRLSIVASIALLVHTLFDGIAIAAAESLVEAIGIAVLTGVAIHQIPTSLSLASLLKSSHLSRLHQTLILALFAVSAPIGYLGGGAFLTSEAALLPLVVAFAG